MSRSGTVQEIAADNTSAVEVTVPAGARHFTVSVFAVDANGDYENVAAGTADLQAKVPGEQTQYETVYDSEDVAESFDVTASMESKPIFNTDIASFKSTPTGLTAAKRLKMVVSYSTDRNLI